MGAKLCGGNKKEIMSVDPPKQINKLTPTFAPTVFKKLEWQVMKAFCQKYKIRQESLIIVFNEYLTHDEIYIRQFRVRTKDAKDRYNGHSKLLRELAEILIPSIYLKQFSGIEEMQNTEEVTFTRFVITSYIFVMSQIPDLMYDFIAILRRRLDIPITVVISAWATYHLVKVMMEDLKPSGSATIILKYMKSISEGPDLRLKGIIRMATKYPLMLFAVHKFRILYRRYVFGDRFWKDRKPLKCKHLELLDFPAEYNDWFETEASALKHTARNIIGDILRTEVKAWSMNDIYYPPYEKLTEEHGTRLKDVLGYKLAMKIMLESEIPYEFDAIFARPYTEAKFAGLKIKVVPVDMDPATLEELIVKEDANENEHDDEEEDAKKEVVKEKEKEKVIRDVNEDERPQSPDQRPSSAEQLQETKEEELEGVVHFDEMFSREFLYDMYSGRSRWAKIIMNAAGENLYYEFE